MIMCKQEEPDWVRYNRQLMESARAVEEFRIKDAARQGMMRLLEEKLYYHLFGKERRCEYCNLLYRDYIDTPDHQRTICEDGYVRHYSIQRESTS